MKCVSGRFVSLGGVGGGGGAAVSEPSRRQFESDTEKQTVKTGRKGMKWILMQQRDNFKDWKTNFRAPEQMFSKMYHSVSSSAKAAGSLSVTDVLLI